VQRLVAVADHRPERASRRVPAREAARADPGSGPPGPNSRPAGAVAALPLHRPAWLLPESLPLAEHGALPLLEGCPLQLLSGPERIETGWWDGDPFARDYYIAQAGDGSLVWVWCSRLPEAPGAARWHLQGRFA